MFVNFLYLSNFDLLKVCLPHTLLLSSGSLRLRFGDSPSFGLAGLELAFAWGLISGAWTLELLRTCIILGFRLLGFLQGCATSLEVAVPTWEGIPRRVLYLRLLPFAVRCPSETRDSILDLAIRWFVLLHSKHDCRFNGGAWKEMEKQQKKVPISLPQDIGGGGFWFRLASPLWPARHGWTLVGIARRISEAKPTESRGKISKMYSLNF